MKTLKAEERSRSEIIMHEIECGGFTESELNDIIKSCEKAIEEENENP